MERKEKRGKDLCPARAKLSGILSIKAEAAHGSGGGGKRTNRLPANRFPAKNSRRSIGGKDRVAAGSNGNAVCHRGYLLRKSSKERILSHKEQSRVQVSLDIHRVWSKCCCVVTSSRDIKEKGRWRAKESETAAAISRSMHPINNCSSLPPCPLASFLPSPSLSASLPSLFPLLSFSVDNTNSQLANL